MKKGIKDLNTIFSEFVYTYNEQVDRARSEKIKQEQLKELNKNKGTVTLQAGDKGGVAHGTDPKAAFRANLSSIFGGGNK
jgi:hypothetical protein